MTTAIAERPIGPAATAIEQALIGGDLAGLNPAQRVSYYNQVCHSLGLNPLTKPFSYIVLNGKLTLYALKDCTEQLRSTRDVTVHILAREVVEDCYVVTAQASLPSSRQDESIGAVSIGGLKGEARANAMMKAETKAKRRVTLSICGLGILDETEVETIPGAAPLAEPIQHAPAGVDARTGEVLESELPDAKAHLFVTKIDVRDGETNGRKWKLYVVHFSDGKEGSTLDGTIALAAEKARDAKTPVDRTLEPGKREGSFKLVELALVQTS